MTQSTDIKIRQRGTETRHDDAQPMFPEFLASDLHAHRAVVEAWASQNLISGTAGDLVGPAVRDGHSPVRLLVTGRLAAREVIIDSLM